MTKLDALVDGAVEIRKQLAKLNERLEYYTHNGYPERVFQPTADKIADLKYDLVRIEDEIRKLAH